jgi:curved DNA-binding protein
VEKMVGKNGDLLVEINIVNDKYMKLYGLDLVTEVPIKPYEAALGCTKIINVLDEQIKIVIPKLSSSGDQLIIKNKGYKNGLGQRGNLRVISKIIMPKTLTEKEQELYSKLKEEDSKAKV